MDRIKLNQFEINAVMHNIALQDERGFRSGKIFYYNPSIEGYILPILAVWDTGEEITEEEKEILAVIYKKRVAMFFHLGLDFCEACSKIIPTLTLKKENGKWFFNRFKILNNKPCFLRREWVPFEDSFKKSFRDKLLFDMIEKY